MKWYSISKTSRVLNISSELLRHYERLGLIHPVRKENGYRYFSFKEIDKLQGIRRYRNMNFSLDQMDKLIYTAGYEEVGELYAASLAKTQQQLIWDQELLRATEMIIEDWKEIGEGTGKCRQTVSRDILRVDMRHRDSIDETLELDEVGEWIEKLPVVFISPAFSREAILSGSGDVSFGYAVETEIFDRLGLKHIEGEQHIPPCRCVTTIVYSCAENYIGAHSLAPVVEYCREEGLNICGNAWGVTIGNCSREGVTYRYHRVFVPVEPS